MTRITISTSKDINYPELTALYREVGLVGGFGKAGDMEKIREAFQKSYKVVIAYADDRIVGAGRMLSDGVCYAMIFDVGVRPNFQKHGVGKQIMTALLEGDEHLKFHLTSTFGNEPFYEKLGFRRHKTAFAKYPGPSAYLIEPTEGRQWS